MKWLKREVAAFTLVEMLVVLLIISVLLMLVIPNIMKQQTAIQKKGCDAYISVVEGQYQVYRIDHPNSKPSIDTLQNEKYIKSTVCPDGSPLMIDGDGNVTKK